MNKSGILITSALLTLGLAAGSMAADMPKSVAPMAADSAPAASADSTKPAKKHKKKKKAAAAPATTK
jgi:hypothetical protein